MVTMAKPVSYGYDRLSARLDIASSDYFPDITIQQAASMKSKYLAFQSSAKAFLEKVRVQLSRDGVGGALVFGYYAAANKMRAAIANLGAGEAGKVEIAAIIVQYTAAGLSQSVLEGIRGTVLGSTAPTP
jgi:hypothetical protein